MGQLRFHQPDSWGVGLGMVVDKRHLGNSAVKGEDSTYWRG